MAEHDGMRNLLLLICIALCAGYFLVGFSPFRPRVANNLGWRHGMDGTYFGWLSSVYSERELDLIGSPSSAGEDGAISVELLLSSGHRQTGVVGTILALYDGHLPPNLLIAQWKSELLLRVPVRNADGRRIRREVGAGLDLRRGIRRFIAVTSGPGGTRFYIDGELSKAYPRLIPQPETLRGRLVVGDAPEGNSHWSGELAGMAVFNRSLDAREVGRHFELWTNKKWRDIAAEPGLAALYNLGERSGRTIPDRSVSGNPLIAPEYYRRFRKTVLVPPWRDPHRYFSDTGDVSLNILGFIPLGFFYFFYRSRIRPGRTWRNLGLAALLSGTISLVIELIQVYLPTRSSTLTDVICNTAGGLAGAFLAALARPLLGPRASAETANRGHAPPGD